MSAEHEQWTLWGLFVCVGTCLRTRARGFAALGAIRNWVVLF